MSQINFHLSWRMKYFSVTDIPFQCKPLCRISKYPEQLIAISIWHRIRHGSVPLLAFHWNETVVLIKLSSLATLKVVKMTILKKLSSLAALKVVKMTFLKNFFITGCTEIDNFQCRQWWKFYQNDNISVSAQQHHEHISCDILYQGILYHSNLNHTPMAYSRNAVSPLLTHWRYCSLMQNHHWL